MTHLSNNAENKRLSNKTLNQLSKQVKSLSYNRDDCKVGIVHIGIGAFHRGHQAVFTHELLSINANKPANNWRISAISLRSKKIKEQLVPQDYLYTVVERSVAGEKIQVIGSLDEVLVAPENPTSVINKLADSSVQVITITVTEKGYCRDSSGQHLDKENPLIIHDINNIQTPKTLPGFIVSACKIRQQQHSPKLTIISCDNLPENGKLTKKIVLEFAQLIDVKLAEWIAENIHFCSSMVDRIVPAVTETDITKTCNKIGLNDQSVIVTEPFKQWVIEDNFAGEKPAWDQAGAIFVKNVEPYEHMKLRLLNGSHSALAYIGFLLGFEYVHQAMEDDDLATFINLLQTQLIETLEDVPGVNLTEYAAVIRERFANYHVPYKTSQVAMDGSQKLPQRLFQPQLILSSKGRHSQYIAFITATWFRYLEGISEAGNPYLISDPLFEKLKTLINSTNETTSTSNIISHSGIFDDEFITDINFKKSVATFLTEIHAHGVRKSLKNLITKQNL